MRLWQSNCAMQAHSELLLIMLLCLVLRHNQAGTTRHMSMYLQKIETRVTSDTW